MRTEWVIKVRYSNAPRYNLLRTPPYGTRMDVPQPTLHFYTAVVLDKSGSKRFETTGSGTSHVLQGNLSFALGQIRKLR